MHQIFLTGASGYIGNLIYQNLSNLYSIKVIQRKDKEINEKTVETNLSPVIIYASVLESEVFGLASLSKA